MRDLKRELKKLGVGKVTVERISKDDYAFRDEAYNEARDHFRAIGMTEGYAIVPLGDKR